tara:strand:+ start:674 stop:976 length:303 start_codon:yes stop_codon:yes gene_type:complete
MLLATFRQQPVEKRRYAIDYSLRLRAGELLATSETITIAPTSTTPLAIVSLLSPDSTQLLLYVSGGETGTTYTAQIPVTTDDIVGDVLWEDELKFIVEEL